MVMHLWLVGRDQGSIPGWLKKKKKKKKKKGTWCLLVYPWSLPYNSEW